MRRAGSERFELSGERALHESATARTGLRDFGDADYLVGLRRILSELASRHGVADDDVLRMGDSLFLLPALIGRLYSQKGWREHPEFSVMDIRDPVFVVGMPRTGTTALHQLLSLDPLFQGAESWLVRTPMPRPPRERWDRFPEYRAAVAAAAERESHMRAVHWVPADVVDECGLFMVQTFVANHFGGRCALPDYDRWFLKQDATPTYRRLADQYRLIGLHTPERRWLVKNPGHLLWLDAILTVFPDACIVVTHRDPLEALPSLCSLYRKTLKGNELPEADPSAIARREAALWKEGLSRMQQVRAGGRGVFVDVWQHDLEVDPVSVARDVYERLGLRVAIDVERAMSAWALENRRGAHGEHHYDGDELGLSSVDISAEFSAYRERFGFSDAAR